MAAFETERGKGRKGSGIGRKWKEGNESGRSGGNSGSLSYYYNNSEWGSIEGEIGYLGESS